MMRGVAVALLCVAGLGLAAHGYAENRVALFYVGTVAAALALWPLAWFGLRDRLPLAARRSIAMIGIYLFTLLGVELGWRVTDAVRPEPEIAPYYNYQTARADPRGFHLWWERVIQRFFRHLDRFAMKDPHGLNPFVLIPNNDFVQHLSKIHVNALGFRGREIEAEKGNRFRIVALGESTTFGLTMLAEDKTWPELLEQAIAERYVCARPVEVINAGVPGWALLNQIERLESDIWPLEPDLLISYHGYNGFNFLLFGLEAVNEIAPPELPERPTWVLGALERTVRISRFRSRYNKQREIGDALARVILLNNPYARQYQRLIGLAYKQGSTVVLATFNMAVNGESPEEVVRFYEASVPDVRMRIRANELHNRIVHAVGWLQRAHVIDTGAGVDGRYVDGYIDIAHMTQLGRERFTANLLAGLETSIGAASAAGCVRRP